MQLSKLSKGLKAAYGGSNVVSRVRHFDSWIDRASSDDGGVNTYDHTETVREYYDLCTGFMVFGWSESLHFTPLAPGESLEDSQIRHQRMMIVKLEMQEGMTVVDVGGGVGGPMRRVMREAGVRVVGVNSNEMQIEKAKSLNAEAGLEHMADYVACCFMDMNGIEDGTFDPADAGHRAIKRDLMHTIALQEIATIDEVDRALEAAGFQVEEGSGLAVEEGGPDVPWYRPVERRRGTLGTVLSRFPLGRKVFVGASRLAEALGLFPKGSADVVRFMDLTATAFVAGGRTGIFTPLYCFLARKPS